MTELYLKVYSDHSEFMDSTGKIHTFLEGKSSNEAKTRYQKIAQTLKGGFLENKIEMVKAGLDLADLNLTEEQKKYITKLVESITSEVGRAIVGLTILQITVKTITPKQSIRLHKGGDSSGQFSWKEGISMRVLDKNFITPILRRHDLLKLNADGFMMTRSLAENYPYSSVYKAKLRGARSEWLLLVEDLESEKLNADHALIFMIAQLINQAGDFLLLRDKAIITLEKFFRNISGFDIDDALKIIFQHINGSNHAARLMEIAMHALLQSLHDLDLLQEELVPLSQMRSANKKHGNIGDIELTVHDAIVESWDAKYGKSYLRDELEELSDKLQNQANIVPIAGFVTTDEPDLKRGVSERIKEIEEIHGTKIHLMKFDDWVRFICEKNAQLLNSTQPIARGWLTAYLESLGQLRREMAPIDEPCYEWLKTLNALLSEI